jgi:hydroxyacylglutathione hydrolase
MEILSAELGPIFTCSYMLVDETTNIVAIIDAPPQAMDYWSLIIEENNYKLSSLLLTHSHWDHAAEVSVIKEKYNCEVYVSKEDEYRIIEPAKHTIWPLPFVIPAAKADKYALEGTLINVGNIAIDVIASPGHTEGGVCYKIEKERVIFTGDTLFNEGIGRTDLPGGDTSSLNYSIKEKLYTLADDFIIYPGHGLSSNLGYEKYNNPYIRKD